MPKGNKIRGAGKRLASGKFGSKSRSKSPKTGRAAPKSTKSKKK